MQVTPDLYVFGIPHIAVTGMTSPDILLYSKTLAPPRTGSGAPLVTAGRSL